jgi:hypothetical protein
VFWVDKIDLIDGVGEAWVANPEGCTGKRKWADAMDFWFPVRDQGLLYSDEGAGNETATLKYVQVMGGTLGMPVTIQKQVGRVYAAMPSFEGVLYTISRGVDFDGLYLYGKLPFASSATGDGGTTTPTVDAGAPAADAAPGGGG